MSESVLQRGVPRDADLHCPSFSLLCPINELRGARWGFRVGCRKGCEGVTADYSLRADGNIDVLNRCRKPGGKVSEARGLAKVVDGTTNAKLKVSFFGPFYGDYWALDHADDYSWSIVGEASGSYLWILDRQATPTQAEVQKLTDRARSLGYDTSMLRRTRQP